MALRTVELPKEILELLGNDNVKKIFLVGEPGVGKIWMAQRLSDHAIKHHSFQFSLWVFLKRKCGRRALQESIDHQLSILNEEWEVEDDNKETKEKEEIQENWEEKISKALEGKRFLLILDDEGNGMKEEIKDLLKFCWQKSSKVLITASKRDGSHESEEVGVKVIEVKPLSMEESLYLFKERAGEEVNKLPGIEPLAEDFLQKTKYLPAAAIMVAKALSYFGQHDSGRQTLESALEEAFGNESYNITQLLCSGYNKLPEGVLIDCCWGGSHFFRDGGGVHYNELIAYWIMEGYLGHVDCIEKAYEMGHHVIMQLIDCRMLIMMEGGYVIMEGAIMNSVDCHRSGFGGTASLGLANVFEDGEWEGLGRIIQADGMIRTLCCGKEGQKVSSLLLDGNRPWREVLDNFPKLTQELQTLALFNPTLISLPLPLPEMHNFCVLVLRGCDFLGNISLNDIDSALKLEKLTVLEISGSGSLRTIPDNLFKHMPHLRSLNLSALQIQSLPSSLYDLGELVWLVLRGCSCLETLGSLKKFEKLLGLDLSGATSLKSIQDKSFSKNKKLQTLNLSHSQIRILPLIKELGELTHLSLSGCAYMDRLRGISKVTCLQVLDLSNSKRFKEFHDQSLENNADLKILDLSGTSIDRLPSKLNPRYLYLKGCSQLKRLSFIETLKDLEELDLSGAGSMVEIQKEFFEHMSHLRVLNLSGTKVKSLPSLSNLSNLRQLLLSCCSDLEKLPDLNFLTKLEMLDLSGCCALTGIQHKSSEPMSHLQTQELLESTVECQPSLSILSNLRHLLLKECTKLSVLPRLDSLSKLEELNLCGIISLKDIGADFLECMTHLQILDLSGTMLGKLPSMLNLKSLKQLYLRGLGLERVPGLEALTQLVVLDLSGTSVSCLPSLDNFTNLRRLLLRDCSRLEKFLELEMLDLLGATVKDLPYGISKLTHLERLDLPHINNITGADIGRTNQYQWSISSFPAVIGSDRSSVSVSSSQFLQFLEKNTSLWDTSFTKFHFCVHPSEGQNKNGDRYLYRNEPIFSDIYFQKSQFAQFKEQRSLEIRGFHDSPKGIEDVLSHAECVFLIDNEFKTLLSDLRASNLLAMRGCWIERCREMQSLFCENEAEDISQVGRTLEILGVSNALNLTSIYSGDMKFEVFQKLKCLYLDCCPNISTVFSSSLLPENLKVLQIKFCDKLVTVFQQTSGECRLRNLDTLHLWELPELKSIGCALPSLQTLKVQECPKLQKLEEHIKSAESLQILWISNVTDLKSICSGSQQPGSFKNLQSLTVESCPMLENVLSSPCLLENLETLKIKYCEKLETLFEQSTPVDYKLPKLCTLHLQDLLKLKRIGVQLPCIQDHVVMECPNIAEPYPVG